MRGHAPTVSRGVLGSAVSGQGKSKSYFSSRNQRGDLVDGIEGNLVEGCSSLSMRKEGGTPQA